MAARYVSLAPQQFLPHLVSANSRFGALLRAADLDAAVPTCPGWNLRDLAWHLGNVQNWTVGAIREGHPNTPMPDGPTEREALVAWFDERAQRLVALLEATSPEAECWSFGPKPRTVAFWFRRQAHEAVVHLWDAENALGTPSPIDAALALDGVDEVASFIVPRQVRLKRTAPLPASLELVVADAGDLSWSLARGTGDGALDGPADARVRGSAEALVLWLWKRIATDDARLEITGDRNAAEAFWQGEITP